MPRLTCFATFSVGRSLPALNIPMYPLVQWGILSLVVYRWENGFGRKGLSRNTANTPSLMWWRQVHFFNRLLALHYAGSTLPRLVCEGTTETLPAPCTQRRVCMTPGKPVGTPLLLHDLGMWACMHQPPRNAAAVQGSKADHSSLAVSWPGPGMW